MKRQNIVKDKSLDFAVQIVNLVKSIRKKEQEFDLTRQLVRSGTAIGALIYESEFAESKRDFSHKLMISLKKLMKQDIGLNSYTELNTSLWRTTVDKI